MNFIDILQGSPAKLLAFQWLNRLVRYFFLAGGAYLIFWKWGYPYFKNRFLYDSMPGRKDRLREIKYSMISSFVLLFPTLAMIALRPYGVAKVYFGLHEHSMIWYILSFPIVFLLHDTYFYWTHRFMHLRKVYPLVHRIHHLSVHPTPFAAFAFHPVEAILESLIFLVFLVTLPLHWSVFMLFSLFSLVINVYGHLGFNALSPSLRDTWPFSAFSHSAHHAWHHRHYNGNYGFYLKFWDQVMGTYQGPLERPSQNK